MYDRSIVGLSIETSESEEHATRLFKRIIRDLGVTSTIIHADNGNPMRGVTLAVFLDSLAIKRSHSLPRCSSDNVIIESWHKTLKSSVGRPDHFESLDDARTWYANFIHWYNTEHRHSAIGYVTPRTRHDGRDIQLFEKRNEVICAAVARTPLRWSGTPRLYTRIAQVRLNPPPQLSPIPDSCERPTEIVCHLS